MKKYRNILATVAGFIIGSLVNMILVAVSGKIIPLPAGVDNKTAEGLAAGMHLMESKHFIFPFLAHALGTLVGAFIATKLSNPKSIVGPMLIGVLFLAGGISMVFMVPSPMWFNCVDLILAYIPMACLGYILGRK
ncbi:hypothetical protein SAMN05421741_1486 [Paenimyroides ummariense]|uniref:Uncharacterized protein n=1 Tax=Paenimyroides ummariense TaxID=913024 RepID=A0A1I5GRA1_9FLAO|nr:hypothetical protein [Paenimyroides ummariense]SFO38449.1 hypothetical protein SAMN05421741_1486 [Paenimyroides ummariense]